MLYQLSYAPTGEVLTSQKYNISSAVRAKGMFQKAGMVLWERIFYRFLPPGFHVVACLGNIEA
jgi:hypothetical protein